MINLASTRGFLVALWQSLQDLNGKPRVLFALQSKFDPTRLRCSLNLSRRHDFQVFSKPVRRMITASMVFSEAARKVFGGSDIIATGRTA
jgi:hypothetical protein